jgi:Anti-sigma regulatory factor (Ser/Thr protein kinase)
MEVVAGEPHSRFAITDTSYIGDLRRHVHTMATALNFDASRCSNAEIISTEIATNLVKFGNGTGEVLISGITDGDGISVLEIISIDSGKGMENTGQMLIDGQTTSGTMGGGLGAVKRLADDFKIDSKPNGGTIIVARMSGKKRRAGDTEYRRNVDLCKAYDIAGISVALKGQTECGDGWSFMSDNGLLTLLVVDGLGHGHEASETTKLAIGAFKKHAVESPTAIMQRLHASLQGTRGAAAAVARIDPVKGSVSGCGVGNIVTRVSGEEKNHAIVCMNGILGFKSPTFREFDCRWSESSAVVMNSDGFKSVMEFGKINCSSSVFAARLRRQYSRATDDSTVLVAQHLRSQ